MKYQVLNENDKEFHISHPDGRKFRVAKKGLSESTIKKIQTMGGVQRFAEGGLSVPDISVPDSLVRTGPTPQETEQEGKRLAFEQMRPPSWMETYLGHNPNPYDPPAPAQPIASADPYANQPSIIAAPLATPQALQAGPTVSSGAGSPEPGQIGMPGAPAKAASDGFGMQMQGLNDMAKAETEKGRQVGAAYDANIEYRKNEMARYDRASEDVDRDMSSLQRGIADSKVDPNRVWNRMETGNKVLAAISLALGGMGGRGNGNVAMDVLNKAIENDVNSQKYDLQKKETLLGMNYKKYGNIQAAHQASLMYGDSIAQAMIGKAAAQSGSAEAMARAKFLIGQIQEQKDKRKSDLMQMMIKSPAHLGGVPENKQVDQINLLTDPKYKENRVPADGMVYQTPTKEAADKMRNVESLVGPVRDLVTQLDQLGPSALVPGTPANNIAHAIRGKLSVTLPLLSGVEVGAKRINKEEIEALKETIDDPSSFKQAMTRGLRNEQFFKNLEGEHEAMRGEHYIGYRGMNSVHGRSQGFK